MVRVTYRVLMGHILTTQTTLFPIIVGTIKMETLETRCTLWSGLKKKKKKNSDFSWTERIHKEDNHGLNLTNMSLLTYLPFGAVIIFIIVDFLMESFHEIPKYNSNIRCIVLSLNTKI